MGYFSDIDEWILLAVIGAVLLFSGAMNYFYDIDTWVVLAVIGVILLLFGVWTFINMAVIKKHGIKTWVEVTKATPTMKSVYRRGGSVHVSDHIYFRFWDVNGKCVEAHREAGRGKGSQGEIEIKYMPKNSKKLIVENTVEQSDFATKALFGGALVLVYASIVMLP